VKIESDKQSFARVTLWQNADQVLRI